MDASYIASLVVHAKPLESRLAHAARAGALHVDDGTDGRVPIPDGAFASGWNSVKGAIERR